MNCICYNQGLVSQEYIPHSQRLWDTCLVTQNGLFANVLKGICFPRIGQYTFVNCSLVIGCRYVSSATRSVQRLMNLLNMQLGLHVHRMQNKCQVGTSTSPTVPIDCFLRILGSIEDDIVKPSHFGHLSIYFIDRFRSLKFDLSCPLNSQNK